MILLLAEGGGRAVNKQENVARKISDRPNGHNMPFVWFMYSRGMYSSEITNPVRDVEQDVPTFFDNIERVLENLFD